MEYKAITLDIDDTFDAATIAYGMRNLADYRQGFAEMARAVRPGGTTRGRAALVAW